MSWPLVYLSVPVEIVSYRNSREAQNSQNGTLIVNYFNEVICKAIELLDTHKLVISGLNFMCHFRYDQEGNVMMRSAEIHLKQDGRRSIFEVYVLDLSSSADCYNEFSHSLHTT